MEVIRKLEIDDLDDMIMLRLGIQNYDLRDIEKKSILLNQDELEIKTKDYIKENLNKTLFMFGVIVDNELVANCGFYLDKHFPTYNNPSGMLGYICNVFTKEEYRNKGYQKKVFNYCFEYAKNIGITSFKLSSLNDNAINMYKKFGFKASDSTYTLKVQND